MRLHRFLVPLAAAIYLNFFTHHWLPDVRWLLAVLVLAGAALPELDPEPEFEPDAAAPVVLLPPPQPASAPNASVRATVVRTVIFFIAMNKFLP